MPAISKMRSERGTFNIGSNHSHCRVICLMDVDSFEAQIYGRDRYLYKSQPYIVINASGRILAANYKAKDLGISRSLVRLDRVRNRPTNLVVKTVPQHLEWDKPMQKDKRRASLEIIQVIKKYLEEFPDIDFEVSSCDEFYFDFSKEVTRRMQDDPFPQLSRKSSTLEGKNYWFSNTVPASGPWLKDRVDLTYRRDGIKKHLDEARFMHGIIIANEIATTVWTRLGFELSAGVSSTKILAKLAAGMQKPNGFTVLPQEGLKRASASIDLKSVPGLGSSKGRALANEFKISKMRSLYDLTENDLNIILSQKEIDTIFNTLRGEDKGAMVLNKTCTDTTGVTKDFKIFKNYLHTKAELSEQILYLCEQIEEKIYEEKHFNNRLATQLEIFVRGTGIFSKRDHGKGVEFNIRRISQMVDERAYLDENPIFIHAPKLRNMAMAELQKNRKNDGFMCDEGMTVVKLEATLTDFDLIN